MATHDVTNQVPDFSGQNLLSLDLALTEALARWGGDGAVEEAKSVGAQANAAATQRLAEQADRNPPVLHTHDRRGLRIDKVDYHPAYHSLMTTAVGHGLTALPWTLPAHSGAHVRRAAGFYLWSQAEAGHLCPISMTYAAAPALRAAPDLSAHLLPKLAARTYDPMLAPVKDKEGATFGMGMTEKQGGSDLRANTTVAKPDGEGYRLTGHKWFCSAPMSDGFLMLAQSEAGVTCFMVPRVLDDGNRNPFALQRLKDKLGNRSNASSEVELDGTYAVRVGDEGRGIRTIIDMVASTRLDCILGSAATMRSATTRAIWHARHRHAFGARLIDQPLMRNVLADLALESEAATVLGLRLAQAIDAGQSDLARIGVALGKFWVCKRTPVLVAEALECLGGAGYVEENGLARLYREAPLNSIWEGSGNVNALDVLRAMTREPASVAALVEELTLARGHSPALDQAIDNAHSAAAQAMSEHAAFQARDLVERLAVTLQASLLVRYAPRDVSDAFVASRIAGEHGACLGTLREGAGQRGIDTLVQRAFPA